MGLETAAAMGAVSLIGSGISAYGQYQEGQEARAGAQAASDAYLYNANLSEEQAQAIAQKQVMSEYKKNVAKDEAIGHLQASAVAGGVVSISGSPLDLMTNSLSNAMLDISIDRYSYQIAERGMYAQAEQERDAAQASLNEGERAYKKGLIGAASTVAKGVVASQLIGSGSYDNMPSEDLI